ncbi:MAG: glycosyltransferase family 2 protein [Lachnospiraceae bacterium]|nr:glycosyltransferase family 2 protein [Lachnospiraceae bacterium]
MDSLFIVMPAYNEEENIEGVVKQWYPVLYGKDEKSRLVIADSGSTDKTHEKLKILQREYPKLEILSETPKQHGPKVIALYDYAIKQGAAYVFQTDSDGQTDPVEFDGFWENRKQYDGIFGYRNAREDGRIRSFVEKIVCFLLRIYFGIKVPDANAPFRLMNVQTVKKYLYKLPSDYHIPNIIITTYFVYYNEKTLFKTISFQSRQGGKNSINILSIIKTGWKALGDFKGMKREMRN